MAQQKAKEFLKEIGVREVTEVEQVEIFCASDTPTEPRIQMTRFI